MWVELSQPMSKHSFCRAYDCKSVDIGSNAGAHCITVTGWGGQTYSVEMIDTQQLVPLEEMKHVGERYKEKVREEGWDRTWRWRLNRWLASLFPRRLGLRRLPWG